MKGKQNRIITIITIGVLFLIWLIVTSKGLVESLIIPSPKSVAGAFLEILEKGTQEARKVGTYPAPQG